MSQFIVVAKIGKPYGVKGWLKVYSHTTSKENLLTYLPWYVQQHGSWQQLDIAESKPTHNEILVRFADCHTPEEARRYVNAEIAVNRENLPELTEAEHYLIDLIDLSVWNLQQECLGTVIDFLETGAHDVLVVQGEKKHLIPFVKDIYIQSIDLKNKKIIVDWGKDF